MKQIIPERFVTYAANEKWPSTARMTIRMCDAIDQAVKMPICKQVCLMGLESNDHL